MLVIVLSGSVNSGKTTTGKALASLLPGAAFIDGDDHGIPSSVPFGQMIDRAIAWLAHRVTIETAPILVIAYPLRDSDFACLQTATAARGGRLLVVTLAPPLELVMADRGDRRLDDWERNRVREMYDEGYASRAFSDLVITKMTMPSQTASEIIQHFHLDAGQ